MTFKLNVNKTKILMLDNNFNVAKLSKETKISRSSLDSILNNGREARVETINKIAEALKVKPSELIEEQ